MSDSQKPHHILIIGGGIIGCTSAYYITHHPSFTSPSNSYSLTLLESSTIAAGASSKAGGLIAKWAYPSRLAKESYEEHKRLAGLYGGGERWGWRGVRCGEWGGRGRVEGEMGVDGGESIRKEFKKGVSGARKGKKKFDTNGLDLDWIDEGLTDAYDPIGTEDDTAQVHPGEFTRSMIELAKQKGGENVRVVEGARVLGIVTIEEDGEDEEKVKGVRYVMNHEQGTELFMEADTIILTAGPWSPTILPSLPITTSKAHSIVIHPTMPLPAHVLFTSITPSSSSSDNTKPVTSPELYPRPNNTLYACGPTSSPPLPLLASLVEPDKSAISALHTAISSISTPIREGEVLIEQACFLPFVSDQGGKRGIVEPFVKESGDGPLIGKVRGVDGLVVATGHAVWGICNSTGTGRRVARGVMGS